MILLKKKNHYRHTGVAEEALELIENGYELIKGASLLKSAKAKPKTKKKPIKKK